MQYVTARFGGKPKVTHVLKSKDGNSLAVTFTVKASTETPGDMTGLALVAVTASGPGKGAVLSDQSFDSQERGFAADDYALLGNTVVRDRDFSEHGLASDNLADALTQADPNRFQEVPPSQCVKGVDY